MYRKTQIQEKRKTKPIKVVALGVPVLIFVLVTVFLTIESASYGARLHKLESEELQLADENKDLKQKLISGSSLKELSQKSSDMGFVKPQNIMYISSDLVVAKAR